MPKAGDVAKAAPASQGQHRSGRARAGATNIKAVAKAAIATAARKRVADISEKAAAHEEESETLLQKDEPPAHKQKVQKLMSQFVLVGSQAQRTVFQK